MRPHRRSAVRRRSWFARNPEVFAILVVMAPMIHWSIKPPKS